MKQLLPLNYFKALTEARNLGYVEDAIIHPNGMIQVFDRPDKFYANEDVHINIAACDIAVLYLIDANDGSCRATAIEYWEHYSILNDEQGADLPIELLQNLV